MTTRSILSLFALATLSLLAAGCTEPGAAGDAGQTLAALQLDQEPDGGQTVLDVRYALFGEPEEHDHEHASEEDAAVETVHEEEEHAHEHGDHDPADEVGDDDVDDDADSDELHAHEHDHGLEGLEHEHEHPVADEDHAGADHDEHGDHDHAAEDDAAHEAGHDHADEDHDHPDHDHADADHDHATSESQEVVMVGIVGGVTNPFPETQPEFPFVKGQAALFLADPAFAAEQQAEGHQHAPGEECAFCAAHAADAAHAVAMVRFVGQDGKPLGGDLQQWGQLKPGQTVVVRGVAKPQPGDALLVDATAFYVRD